MPQKHGVCLTTDLTGSDSNINRKFCDRDETKLGVILPFVSHRGRKPEGLRGAVEEEGVQHRG